jgi:hypothetical protein
MPELKRLRELPGVMEIEAMCGVAEPWDGYNRTWTRNRIDAVSVSLFGLPYGVTSYDWFDWEEDGEEQPTEEQWEALLSNANRPYSETEQFWTALGWDITDGRGRELNCAHWFARQIIVCESGLVDGAVFTPDGTGKAPVYAGPEPTEDELTERLEDEVRSFLMRRGRA